MITTQDLAGVLARAAGQDWPPHGDNCVPITYHWLAQAEAVMPAISADRAELARTLDRMATHARLQARRHDPGTWQRISQIAEAGAYAWAATVVRGENA